MIGKCKLTEEVVGSFAQSIRNGQLSIGPVPIVLIDNTVHAVAKKSHGPVG